MGFNSGFKGLTFRHVKILVAFTLSYNLKVTTQVLPLSVGLGKLCSTVVWPPLRSTDRSVFTPSLFNVAGKFTQILEFT